MASWKYSCKDEKGVMRKGMDGEGFVEERAD